MIAQIVIGITGIWTIWLTQDPRERIRRWACVVALVGQPFWFYAMYSAEQWGILVLCVFYTAGWIRGFYYHWIKRHE